MTTVTEFVRSVLFSTWLVALTIGISWTVDALSRSGISGWLIAKNMRIPIPTGRQNLLICRVGSHEYPQQISENKNPVTASQVCSPTFRGNTKSEQCRFTR